MEGSDPEAIVVRFFGIFFFFFQCNRILGNLITTAVLSEGTDSNLSDEEMLVCGSQYCAGQDPESSPEEGAEVFNENFNVDINKIYIIMGIFLGCSIAAGVLIALFVDPLTRFGITEEKKNKEKLSGLQLLVTILTIINIVIIVLVIVVITNDIHPGGHIQADDPQGTAPSNPHHLLVWHRARLL